MLVLLEAMVWKSDNEQLIGVYWRERAKGSKHLY